MESIGKYKLKFNFDEMLALSRLELAKAQSQEINSAITKPNEARLERNLPSDPDGDKLLINQAMQAVGTSRDGDTNEL